MNEGNNVNKINNQYTQYAIETTFTNVSEKVSSEVKNKSLISIGNCYKFYFYILGSAFFKVLSLMILGDKDSNFGLFGFSPILSSYNSMQSIYTYLGYIIFGIISYFCFNGKEKKKYYFLETLSFVKERMKNQDKNKTKFQIFFVCFCFSIYKETQNLLFYFGYQPLDYWTFEVIFTFLLMKKYFEVDIYKHHICSIIMISIICTFLLFAASFFPNSNEGNQYEFVEEQLGNYLFIFIFILIFMFISFIYSFTRNFSKVLMQTKFVSQYILIFFIGITGLIFSIIISLITYFCGKDDNFISYFEALITHSTSDILLDILLISPLFMFFQFMQIYFEILTIYYLNPMYCLLLNNICYGIQRLVLFLFNIKMEYFVYFLLCEISEIVAIIGYTIYLEIIELNFCGLSDNIKRKIIIKGEKEFNKLNEDKIESILAVEENEEEEDDSVIGVGKYEEMLEKRKNSKK